MTASRCIGLAMVIRRQPKREWKDAIAALKPCAFDDCSHPAPAETRCQEVAKDYLRVHWRGAK